MTLLKLTLYCSGGVQDRAGGEMVREGGEEPGQETYDSLETSVADLGCLSRIPDPKTETKERGEKKLLS
jgi:hypothetical protein